MSLLSKGDLERLARKSRSEAILARLGVSMRGSLPAIESADEVVPREPIEIARRAVCLLLVATKAGGIRPSDLRALIEQFEVQPFFTPDEQAYLQARGRSKKDVQFSWRTEACWVLLWSLGFVDELGLPTTQIEPDMAIEIVDEHGVEGLAANPARKTIDEILDAADLIYRCHWETRHAALEGTVANRLDAGIIFERHWALNWLIRYENQEWDHISTDT